MSTAPACSIGALYIHTKPITPDVYGNTKARRARELRPRRNYLLNEDVEKQRRSLLQRNPEVESSVPDVEASSDLLQNLRYT